jgi:hypothetical protein
MLAIQYACPGGYAVNAASTVERRVVFDSRGVACVQERYQDLFPRAGRRIRSAHTTRGQPISIIQELSTNATQGDIITITAYLNTPTNAQGESFTLTLLWVGNRHVLDELLRDGSFANVVADFKKKHFRF